MNKDLTLVFSSYQSQLLLKKILDQFHKKYKIIIIENSLDQIVKEKFEKKFKNVEVIIPNKNLGLAKSYNLGIKKSKTKFVFLNNPDMSITNQSIKELLFCAKKNIPCMVSCVMASKTKSHTLQSQKINQNYVFSHKKNNKN